MRWHARGPSGPWRHCVGAAPSRRFPPGADRGKGLSHLQSLALWFCTGAKQKPGHMTPRGTQTRGRRTHGPCVVPRRLSPRTGNTEVSQIETGTGDCCLVRHASRGRWTPALGSMPASDRVGWAHRLPSLSERHTLRLREQRLPWHRVGAQPYSRAKHASSRARWRRSPAGLRCSTSCRRGVRSSRATARSCSVPILVTMALP